MSTTDQPDLTDDVIADRIRAACAAQVVEIPADDRRFVARSVPGGPTVQGIPDAPAGRGRRRLVAAAVAAALIVGGLATAIALRGDDRPERGGSVIAGKPKPPKTTDLGDGPTLLVPSADPDFLGLQDVQQLDGSVLWAPTVQLFGAPGGAGPRMLLEIDPDPLWTLATTSGTAVTVHGREGIAATQVHGRGSGSVIRWTEPDGLGIEASYRGYSLAEAVSIVDAMSWRSNDHEGGLVAREGGATVLLGESAGATRYAGSAILSYAPDPTPGPYDRPPNVMVRTFAGPAGMSADYLRAWFQGERDDQGVARSMDSGGLPGGGLARLAWPDGRMVWIDATGVALDPLQLDAIIDGLRPRSAASLTRMEQALDQRYMNGSTATEVHLGSGAVVERRGKGLDAWPCLEVQGVRRCAAGPDLTPSVSMLIDGHWYIGALSTEPPSARSWDPKSNKPPVDLPAEIGRIGYRYAMVVRVPDDLDEVTVNSGNQGYGVRRPQR